MFLMLWILLLQKAEDYFAVRYFLHVFVVCHETRRYITLDINLKYNTPTHALSSIYNAMHSLF
jgi:hypothetical protein